jgi:hypothetical protein
VIYLTAPSSCEENVIAMKRSTSRFFLLAATLLVLVSAGCTSMGGGFDDPVGEMSLVGDLRSSCVRGAIFYFGQARNTGDLTLRDVRAYIDVYNGAGGFIGRYEGFVSKSAEVEEITDEDGEVIGEPIVTFDDIFEVGEMGVFNIQSTVGCGSAAREEVSFGFTAPYTEEF